MGMVGRPGDDGVGTVILASGTVGLLGGATLGLLEPLFVVGIGAGLYAGPSWVGLLFLLCIPVALVSGLLVMVAGNRAATLPVLAFSTGLGVGLLAGNWLAMTLGIGFAA
jgi:hypothetical protein